MYMYDKMLRFCSFSNVKLEGQEKKIIVIHCGSAVITDMYLSIFFLQLEASVGQIERYGSCLIIINSDRYDYNKNQQRTFKED